LKSVNSTSDDLKAKESIKKDTPAKSIRFDSKAPEAIPVSSIPNGDDDEKSCYISSFTHNGLKVTSETFQVLNELVVDRGPSAYMSQLELFGDERHLTTVQADGLVVSTPTGSTAYSVGKFPKFPCHLTESKENRH
jgi:hypothetical protein